MGSIAEAVSIQEAWERVFGSKSVLLVENFPPGLEFGLNCMVYETGPMFKGVAMIPEGLHFVYYSHINFPRQGFFTRSSSVNPLRCRNWDNKEDELLQIGSNEVLAQKVYQIVNGDFNAGLAPYSEEHHHIWQNISQYITDKTLQQANCALEKTLRAGDDNDETDGDRELSRILTSDPKRPSFLNNQTALTSVETAQYCPIQSIESDIVKATYQQADFVKRLSAMELDKSWLIEAMLARYYPDHHWSSLLGELQISFIMFMLLYSYHSLNHWKLLIGYLSKAESFLQTNQDFAAAFLKVLFHQLKFIPEDFFENEISANSFILPSLTSLFSCLNFAGLGEDLQEHKKRFERYIAKRFSIRVVSTTISQYQNLLKTGKDAAADDDEIMHEEAKELGDGVADSYCVLDGQGEYVDEELAAEIAGEEAMRQHQRQQQHQHQQQQQQSQQDSPQPMDESTGIDGSPKVVQYSIPADKVLSPADKEELRFSWRYPIVFEAMRKSRGTEDMIMTAMRLYDEYECAMMINPASVTKAMEEAHVEAIKFIENEGPLM